MTQALPVLLQKIKTDGANTMPEAAIFHVERSLSAIMQDPILKDFPFDTVSFSKIVFSVIKSGTTMERAALARHLSPEAAYFFPSASTQIGSNRDYLIGAIEDVFKPMFRRLTEHFGVPFNGDPDSVAYSLLTQFGGLSFADFLICFERVKTGRYISDTQHIMTRGINGDFLISWVKAYEVEKDAAGKDIYDQFKPDNVAAGKGDIETSAQLKEWREQAAKKAAARLKLSNEAGHVFSVWENGLYTNGIMEQWFKWQDIEIDDLGTDGLRQYDHAGNIKKKVLKQEVLCDASDPKKSRSTEYAIRVPKPGTIERKVKKLIYEFIAFSDSKATVEFFDAYKEVVQAKYKGEDNIAGHVEAEFKIILSSADSLLRKVTPTFIVDSVFRHFHPKATDKHIASSVCKTLIDYDGLYYDEYLPECIKNGYPRLERDEWIVSQTLPEFIKVGNPNLFKELFQ